MSTEKILNEIVEVLGTSNLDDALKLVRNALYQEPSNHALLQAEAKVHHLRGTNLIFDRPYTINFLDTYKHLNLNSGHTLKISNNCYYSLDERFANSQKLELFHIKDAYLTSTYGIHNHAGTPYWGSVITRGNSSEVLTYPRGYPAKIIKPEDPELILDEGFYINFLQMHHFGHFLTETASAIYPLLSWVSNKDFSSLPILINEKYSSQDFQVSELVSLLGINREQIILVGKHPSSVRVRSLLMSKPTHINRAFASKNHASIVRKVILKKLNHSERSLSAFSTLVQPIKKLYISRSRLSPNVRIFAQERELELKLMRLGWNIFHPECHNLITQISTYEASSLICAAEGSAVHLLYGTLHKELKKFVLLCRNTNNNFTRQLSSQQIKFECIACLEKIKIQQGAIHSPTLDNVQLKSDFDTSELATYIDAISLND